MRVRGCEMNSRVKVAGFYEKLRYEREGEVFEEIGIPHVKMRKGISDARSIRNFPKRV